MWLEALSWDRAGRVGAVALEGGAQAQVLARSLMRLHAEVEGACPSAPLMGMALPDVRHEVADQRAAS